ncbi:MAG TPA: TetR family transcriptional regulator, partial [Gaiellaceae bacterium]|nr:TetR family transcriptional regulator [Gaiellaceae bacterium]
PGARMAQRNAERRRDAERTRQAILVAAEDCFARRGFDGASLQQIAEAAGVARSTPAYFFGSKEALYDAVLARAVARAQETMARAYAEDANARSVEDAVESYVGAFLDFLGHDQNFLRLVQREALGDASRLAEFFSRSVDEALAAVGPAAQKAGISPERLVLDLTALCWYPFAHEHTLLPALGMKARDPAFLAEQKRHLGALVRAMTRSDGERRSRRQRS